MSRLCPIHILVVDDDESIHWSVSSILKKYRHIDVEHAYSVRDLRKRIEERPFQFIFLDIYLPDGDGLDEVGWIRARQPACQIHPLTVERNPDYIARRSKVGVDGWIPKGSRFPSHLIKKVVLEGDRSQQANGSLLRVRIPTIDAYPNMSQTFFMFESRSDLLDDREQQILKAIIRYMLSIPKREASEDIAECLGLAHSSLTESLERVRLPAFCDLKRTVTASSAVVMQWRNPAISVDCVVEAISSYHPRSLARIVHQLFDARLETVSRSPALIGFYAGTPIPICFIHGDQPPSRDGIISIHTVVGE